MGEKVQQSENNNPESQTQNPVTAESLSLIDFLLIIARHKKLIFGTTFGVAVLTAILSLFMHNIYTAKAMILPGEDDKGMMMGAMLSQIAGIGGGGGLGGMLGGATKADQYVSMLKSETVKDPIIDKFGLMKLYKVKFRADAYKRLGVCSKISAGKKDGIITIEVSDKNPKLAAELANAYVDELGKLAAGLGMTGSGKNRVFLEKRLVEAKADLAKAEENLKAFQTKNKAISVPDQARATIEGVGQLRAQLAAQEVQLAVLQSQFTASSNEVKTAKASIANIRAQIASLEGKGGGSSIPPVGTIPQLGQEYVRLMREYKIQEAVLELLTKQYEMVKINEVKDVSPFQLVQKAKVPDKKSKPSRTKLVILITVIIFGFSTGYALVKEYFFRMNMEELTRWKELQTILLFYRNFKH